MRSTCGKKFRVAAEHCGAASGAQRRQCVTSFDYLFLHIDNNHSRGGVGGRSGAERRRTIKGSGEACRKGHRGGHTGIGD